MIVLFRIHGRAMPRFALWYLLFLFCWAGGALAQGHHPERAVCSWDEPTYGTAVVYYVVELEIKLGETLQSVERVETAELYYEFDMITPYVYRAHVAGVDAEGRQGPWSIWTAPYTPEALPEDYLKE